MDVAFVVVHVARFFIKSAQVQALYSNWMSNLSNTVESVVINHIRKELYEHIQEAHQDWVHIVISDLKVQPY